MRITHGYKRDDVPRLRELSDTCFVGLERPPHTDFDNMLKTSEVWVARLDEIEARHAVDAGHAGQNPGRIVGYIIINRHYGTYLWSVAVDPAFRHRGIAGNLIREAELWCKSAGDKNIRLHCHAANPSQKLYFDRGYRVYDLAHSYYGDGTIALMMQKGL